MLVMFGVVGDRNVIVKNTLLVEAIVQGTVSAHKHQAHSAIRRRVRSSADGVDEVHRAFDLFQDGESIRRREKCGSIHLDHYRGGVSSDDLRFVRIMPAHQ